MLLGSKGWEQGSLALESGSSGFYVRIRGGAVLYLCDYKSHYWYRKSEVWVQKTGIIDGKIYFVTTLL